MTKQKFQKSFSFYQFKNRDRLSYSRKIQFSEEIAFVC